MNDKYAPNVWHPMPIPEDWKDYVEIIGALHNGETAYRYVATHKSESDYDLMLGSWVKNGKINSAGVEESDWIWYPATHWLWRNVPDIPN